MIRHNLSADIAYCVAKATPFAAFVEIGDRLRLGHDIIVQEPDRTIAEYYRVATASAHARGDSINAPLRLR